MKVLFHFNASASLHDDLKARCGSDIELVVCPEADERGLADHLPTTEAIWHVLKPISADDICRAPHLRLIQKLGVGVNTIALDEARLRGIAVCNTPGANSRAVAEMALLLILAGLRRFPEMSERCRLVDGWAIPDKLQQNLTELGGRTVGLVGFGAVPSMLAPWLAAMGAHVIYHASAPKPGIAFEYAPLDELIRRSDVLSLHLPLTAETDRIVTAERLKAMKPGSLLVNTARGGLIDEAALIEALSHGPLGAAALDVFAEEPIRSDHPLLQLPNVVTTPHTAWLTRETLLRCLAIALDNTKRLQSGQALIHRVV